MDALAMLEQDHRTVEALFKEIEGLGPRAEKKKRELVAQVIRELSIHSVVEEQLIYPAIRAKKDLLEESVLEALEEHLVVKWTLAALDDMAPKDERYDAKLKVLKDMVEHHVEEEEQHLFPSARKVFDASELEELGTAVARLKKVAPTRPHPRAPDQPPGNLIAGAVASVMDRSRDLISGRKSVAKPRAAAKTQRASTAKGRASVGAKRTGAKKGARRAGGRARS